MEARSYRDMVITMTSTLFALFCVLQALDVYTTDRALRQGGRELNPLLAKLFEVVGDHLPVLIASKLLITAAVWYYIADPVWLGGLCIFYGLVVFNNFNQIKS